MTDTEVRYVAEITEQRNWITRRPTGRWNVKLHREDMGRPAIVWRDYGYPSYNAAHQAADRVAWRLRQEDKERTYPDRIEVAKERDEP